MPAREGLGEHKYGHEELKRRIYVLQQTDSRKPKLACGERIKDQRRRGNWPTKRQKQAIGESAPECPGSLPSTSYIFGCKSLIFGGPDFEWALHRGTFPRSLPPVSGLCHPPARRAAVFRVGWSRNGASFHPRPRLR